MPTACCSYKLTMYRERAEASSSFHGFQNAVNTCLMVCHGLHQGSMMFLHQLELCPRKLHPLFSPEHLDFVTEKKGFFRHLENTIFQTLPKNAFFIRFALFLMFLGGSNNHSLVQNQRAYRSFSLKKIFVC